MQLWMDEVDSPIGVMLLVHNSKALCALDFDDCETRMLRFLETRYGPVQLERRNRKTEEVRRVQDYLRGDLDALRSIKIDPGGTDFQRQVWTALRRVRSGTTISYGALAQKLQKPTAARAVGMANALNPIALIVPCHRVIGANGSLTGYAGGLRRKRWLLEHEGIRLPSLSEATAPLEPSLGF